VAFALAISLVVLNPSTTETLFTRPFPGTHFVRADHAIFIVLAALYDHVRSAAINSHSFQILQQGALSSVLER
jgi:hypothetical protein